MIKEAYVSFEIARLLKEKNFNEACEHQYYVIDKKLGTYNTTDRSRNPERYIDAPTHQMVMAWLREKGLFIQIGVVDHSTITIPEKYYFFRIYENRRYISHDRTETYYTYEEAVESALKYCLEEVI